MQTPEKCIQIHIRKMHTDTYQENANKSRSMLCVCSLSCVQLFATLLTIAHQASLSMGFCRQEYWGGLPCPPPEELPYPGIKPKSSALASGFFTSCCKKLSHTW